MLAGINTKLKQNVLDSIARPQPMAVHQDITAQRSTKYAYSKIFFFIIKFSNILESHPACQLLRNATNTLTSLQQILVLTSQNDMPNLAQNFQMHGQSTGKA